MLDDLELDPKGQEARIHPRAGADAWSRLKEEAARDWHDLRSRTSQSRVGQLAAATAHAAQVRAQLFANSLTRRRLDWGQRLRNRFPVIGTWEARFKRWALETAARTARAYASMTWANSALLTVVLTALLFSVDSMTGNLEAFHFLYMPLIWLAARLAGPASGFFAMLVVGGLLSVTDSGSLLGNRDAATLNFAIRWIGLGGFLLSVLQIENALRSARQQATHDPLTGLVNRTAIEALANFAIARRGQDGRLHVALIDCDDFKALNDANGHAFGDHALKVLARRLEACVKDVGQIGRTGGDEFVVLFEGITSREARAILDKANAGYRRILASLGYSVGISYGLSTLGKDGQSFDRLCRIADERMYAWKHLRRAGIMADMPSETGIGLA